MVQRPKCDACRHAPALLFNPKADNFITPMQVQRPSASHYASHLPHTYCTTHPACAHCTACRDLRDLYCFHIHVVMPHCCISMNCPRSMGELCTTIYICNERIQNLLCILPARVQLIY